VRMHMREIMQSLFTIYSLLFAHHTQSIHHTHYTLLRLLARSIAKHIRSADRADELLRVRSVNSARYDSNTHTHTHTAFVYVYMCVSWYLLHVHTHTCTHTVLLPSLPPSRPLANTSATRGSTQPTTSTAPHLQMTLTFNQHTCAYTRTYNTFDLYLLWFGLKTSIFMQYYTTFWKPLII
jgi:hypothetical protein